MRWLCVKHVFACEALDGGSDNLVANAALCSDVPFTDADGPARDIDSVALDVVRGVFPGDVIHQPHPDGQALWLALKQMVRGDAALYCIPTSHSIWPRGCKFWD